MSYSDKLQNILKDQEKIHQDLSRLSSDISKNEEIGQSEKQEVELEKLRRDNGRLRSQLESLESKNQEQHLALLNLAASEKSRILGLSRRGREVYFKKRDKPVKQQLGSLEKEVDRRIERFQNRQYLELGDKRVALLKEVERHSREIQDSLKAVREELKQKEDDFLQEMDEKFKFHEKEPVTEEQLERRVKRNQWEMKIGLKWLNKAGIILVLVSVGFLAYYARNSYTQAFLITLLGILFLGAAEWFYRRGRLIFAQSLMGGGVGILYSGVFFSHFVLQVDGLPLIGRSAALILVIAITLLTLFLAWFRNSETILTLGLAGGFLPFVATLLETGFPGSAVYLAMIYLLLINLAVLILSFFKEWRTTGGVSFLLNTPAMIYLIFKSPSKGAGLIYLFLIFFLYLAVVLVPRFRLSRKLNLWDVLLLGTNSLCAAVVSFSLAVQWGVPGLRALFALGFALLFFYLARRVQTKGERQTGEFLLFLGTSLTFALWLIPLLFGIRSMTLGFLLETLILITLGHWRKYPWLEKAGWAAFWGTLASLLFWALMSLETFRDLLGSLFTSQRFSTFLSGIFEVEQHSGGGGIHWNLILFTLGCLGINIQYTPWLKGQGESSSRKVEGLHRFRLISLILAYLTLMGETESILSGMQRVLSLPAGTRDSLILITLSLLSLAFSAALLNIPAWKDRKTRMIGLFTLSLSGLMWLLFLLDLPGNPAVLHSITWRQVGRISLAALYNGLLLWTGGSLLRKEIIDRKGSQGSFPQIFSILILLNTALFIFRFLPVETPALLYGFAYLIASWILIWRGFQKSYPPLRILGLVTLFLSLLILILPILSQAEPLYRIISFLVYGLLMLGISLIYQNISIKRGEDED